jgi:hypothetical protein
MLYLVPSSLRVDIPFSGCLDLTTSVTPLSPLVLTAATAVTAVEPTFAKSHPEGPLLLFTFVLGAWSVPYAIITLHEPSISGHTAHMSSSW